MADQYFHADRNRFWIDLHKCATYEAVSIIEKRIDECFNYGVTKMEIIYGTPDNYEGSIQQAVSDIAEKNEKVETQSEFHAGTNFIITQNPNPMPQDDSMSFSGFSASYENYHKAHPFEREYFPCRKEIRTVELSKHIGCSMEYIRSVLRTVSTASAESINEYNPYTKRNEQRWRIYNSGADKVHKQWKEDQQLANDVLIELGAAEDETEHILASIKKPFDSEKSAVSRLKGALTRLRRKK